MPVVPTKARACKYVYKHAVAPPSVSSRGHTVGTGNEFNCRGYLDIDVLSLCTNIRSLIQHQMDKCNAWFACGDGESSENIPVRGTRIVHADRVNALIFSPVRVRLLSGNTLCETLMTRRGSPSPRYHVRIHRLCGNPAVSASVATGLLLPTNTRSTLTISFVY